MIMSPILILILLVSSMVSLGLLVRYLVFRSWEIDEQEKNVYK